MSKYKVGDEVRLFRPDNGIGKIVSAEQDHYQVKLLSYSYAGGHKSFTYENYISSEYMNLFRMEDRIVGLVEPLITDTEILL